MTDYFQYDVVIVGAGLAGLRAAQLLDGLGLSVVIVERADHVGGRVHSFDVDGFVVDEGFQLINPAYPELRASGVTQSLDLRPFPPVLTYVEATGEWTIADPRRHPWVAIRALLQGHPRFDDAWRLVNLFATSRWSSVRRLTSVPDRSTRQGLLDAGFTADSIDNLLAPVLQGTLLDADLETSWRYTRLLVKSFSSGRPATPAHGARQLPRSMIASMPSVDLRLYTEVSCVTATAVRTDNGEILARAILVATDHDDARALVGTPSTHWRSTTTWWLNTPRVTHGERLRLDLVDRSIMSMLDLASVASERAPAARSLIAVATLGDLDASGDDRIIAAAQRIYGLDRADIDIVARTPVVRALPRVVTPLRLNAPSRRGDIFLAGDYLQTPSIQGALVSGRRAATAIAGALGVQPADAQ